MTQLVNRQNHEPTPVVLSIAGFDPSSGAGITADIKTIAAHGCYGATCITALTVQTTQGVRAVEAVKPEIVRATLRELAADLPVSAVRIGMLGSAAVVEAVVEFLESTRPPNVVLDPVVRSSSGAELLEPGRSGSSQTPDAATDLRRDSECRRGCGVERASRRRADAGVLPD